MKKKIALFANAWSVEYLQDITQSMLQYAKKNDMDIFCFVNYSSYVDESTVSMGEANIFRLPNLKEFDGAVLLTNTFNRKEDIEYLQNEVLSTGIPAVSLEYELEGITSILTDNYSGMYELASHVINEHGVRKVLYVSGHNEHPDSITRQRAVADVMKEAGLSLDDSNTVAGNWSSKISVVEFEAWVKKNGMPEAVMCANDEMACAIFDYLEKNEYNIPQDIIVTGYDCTKKGQLYYSSLTSVNHDWELMGTTALNLISEMIEGKKVDDKVILKSVFVSGGSCGCPQSEEYYKKIRRENTDRKIDWISSDSHFRHMNSSMSTPDDARGLSMILAGFFDIQHSMEGERFMLCLEPAFFHVSDENSRLMECGYSGEVEVVCCLFDGKKYDYKRMKKDNAISFASDNSDDNSIYIFVPVYSTEGKTYGYAMLSRDMRILDDNMLYIWTRHMNQSIEQVRRNIKINELTNKLKLISVTDALTGIYNRAGCEQIIYPMLRECSINGRMSSIMLIDMDGLKIINDIYGHANGDLAICSIAEVLKSAFPEDWYISRIGGDEFVAAGPCDSEEYVMGMLDDIQEKLAQKAKDEDIPFVLSASVGYSIILPSEEFDVERSLKKADEYMYKMKKEHHMYSR